MRRTAAQKPEPEATATGGRLARILFLTAALILPAQAQLDTTGNGMSDVWERYFNNGELFDPENPAHHPDADPDRDGWTNLQEDITDSPDLRYEYESEQNEFTLKVEGAHEVLFDGTNGVGIDQEFEKNGDGFDAWHFQIPGWSKRLIYVQGLIEGKSTEEIVELLNQLGVGDDNPLVTV